MEKTQILKEAVRFIFTVAAASTIGGYFAHQKAVNAPVQAQYAVVDMTAFARSMQKNIDPNKPSGQIAIKEMGDALQSRLRDLTDAGVVILDAGQVVAAPKSAMIDPADFMVFNQDKTGKGAVDADKPSK